MLLLLLLPPLLLLHYFVLSCLRVLLSFRCVTDCSNMRPPPPVSAPAPASILVALLVLAACVSGKYQPQNNFSTRGDQ